MPSLMSQGQQSHLKNVSISSAPATSERFQKRKETDDSKITKNKRQPRQSEANNSQAMKPKAAKKPEVREQAMQNFGKII